jgi:hypothetical protein
VPQAWAYLTNTYNDWEADVIAGLLETHDIPIMRKYPGNSGIAKIYLGTSFGVDLYVPEEKLVLAKSILLRAQQDEVKE